MTDLLNFLQREEEAFRSPPRLASLYSDFSQRRSTNPDGYAANSAAWLKALNTASQHGLLPHAPSTSQQSRLTIYYGQELESALQSPKWGRPLALNAVVQDAVAQQAFVPLRDFLSTKKSLYSRSWTPSPWKAVGWGLRQLGLSGEAQTPRLSHGSFVSVANVEARAKALMDHLATRDQSYTSRVMSKRAFESEISKALRSSLPGTEEAEQQSCETDTAILLAYLSRDKPILSHADNTIKLYSPGNCSSTDTEVTRQDKTIANLADLVSSLETQVETLHTHIATLNRTIKSSLAEKSTVNAKHALKSRKLAESTLETRSSTLLKLQGVYASIESAAGNVEVVRAMEESAAVLGDLTRRVGGVEGVEGVVERLKVQMEDAGEVEDILGSVTGGEVIGLGQGPGAIIDEEELERELQDLSARDGVVERETEKETEEEMAAETVLAGTRAHGGKIQDEIVDHHRHKPAQSKTEVAGYAGSQIAHRDPIALDDQAKAPEDAGSQKAMKEAEAQARGTEELERRLAELTLPPSDIKQTEHERVAG